MNSDCHFNVEFSWTHAIENLETTLSLNRVVEIAVFCTSLQPQLHDKRRQMRKQLGQVRSLGTPKRVGETGQMLSDLTTKSRLLDKK